MSGAGATVIGARQPLIAFNVYLTTDDVSIANKIARVIRNSSGGLRFVKSMGVLVEGRAQVSMNLTNFHKTSMARVVEMIRREAQRYGVQVHHSELVGLVPSEALVDAAVWYMQMDQFEPDQILESKLFEKGAPSRMNHCLWMLNSSWMPWHPPNPHRAAVPLPLMVGRWRLHWLPWSAG